MSNNSLDVDQKSYLLGILFSQRKRRRLEFLFFFFGIKIIPGADLRQAVFALFLLLFFHRSRSSGAVGPGQRGGGSFFSAAGCGSASPPALPQSTSPRHQHLRRRASIQESQGQVSERTLKNSLIIQGSRKRGLSSTCPLGDFTVSASTSSP